VLYTALRQLVLFHIIVFGEFPINYCPPTGNGWNIHDCQCSKRYFRFGKYQTCVNVLLSFHGWNFEKIQTQYIRESKIDIETLSDLKVSKAVFVTENSGILRMVINRILNKTSSDTIRDEKLLILDSFKLNKIYQNP
jgi:hypothetical protein